MQKHQDCQDMMHLGMCIELSAEQKEIFQGGYNDSGREAEARFVKHEK